MNKCIGNCAKCTLNVDKMACCMVQILKNTIEIRKMVFAKITANTSEVFKGLEDIESEGATDSAPVAPGTGEGG